MLTKDKDALLNVSDTYYGNATLHPLPHPESPNGTQWGSVCPPARAPDLYPLYTPCSPGFRHCIRSESIRYWILEIMR